MDKADGEFRYVACTGSGRPGPHSCSTHTVTGICIAKNYAVVLLHVCRFRLSMSLGSSTSVQPMLDHMYSKGMLTAEMAFTAFFRDTARLRSEPVAAAEAVVSVVKAQLASKGVA